MNTQQLTCQDECREEIANYPLCLDDHLELTLLGLWGILEIVDKGNEAAHDAAQDDLVNYPYSITERRTKIVELSFDKRGGGPASQLEYDLYEDGGIMEIRYRFSDWGNGAVRTLEGNDYVLAERLYHEWVA